VPARRVGDAYAIRCSTEPDLLAVFGDEPRTCDVAARLDVEAESESSAADSLDDALRRAVIVERLTKRLDAAVEGGGGHEPMTPHVFDKLPRSNKAITVLDEMTEHGVHLWLEVLRLVGTPQLAALRVQREVFPPVDHAAASLHEISMEPP